MHDRLLAETNFIGAVIQSPALADHAELIFARVCGVSSGAPDPIDVTTLTGEMQSS